jgi:hypothetical protein
MPKIFDHKTGVASDLNSQIDIHAVDEPGAGGAYHRYELSLISPTGPVGVQELAFQHGPIGEAGLNGISNEALMAIVIHRLRCFQGGAFSCRENAIAITKLEEALLWLNKRTRDRIARGVEGTSIV